MVKGERKMSFAGFLHINWGLILAVAAIIVTLYTTVQFSRKISLTLLIVTVLIIALSVVDYIEIYLGNQPTLSIWRAILTAFKYILTAFILAGIGATLFRWDIRMRFLTYIPAVILTILCLVSIPTGIVFSFLEEGNSFQRGPLGYLPFIVSGLYLCYLLVGLVFLGRKTLQDLLPIVLMATFSVFSLIFPLVWPEIFDGWFATTIAVSVLLYSIFLLEQLAKKDPLTNLLNRQTYYHDTEKRLGNFHALVFIDMNGLKAINDTAGHEAGDEALLTLSRCIASKTPLTDRIYRIGGDEFILLSRESDEEVVKIRLKRILEAVEEKNLSVSIGYCMLQEGIGTDEAFKKADAMMYEQKRAYYKSVGNRRKEDEN